MKSILKTLFPYAIVLGGLTFMVNYLRYKHFLYDLHTEVYIGVIGITFLGVGLWLGNKLLSPAPITATMNEPSSPAGKDLSESFGLSKRELDVWALMSKGHTNQEIAEKLFISLSTVKTHTSNLYSKLGVRNRSSAIVLAKENGLRAD